jgi:cobalamin-dependent methionine synthase I
MTFFVQIEMAEPLAEYLHKRVRGGNGASPPKKGARPRSDAGARLS